MTKQDFLEATKGYAHPGVVLAVDFENVSHMHRLIVQARELLNPKVEKCCMHCGSRNVVREAPVRWNIETQTWELSGDPYDGATCEECNDETKLVDVEVGNA
jgi:hypothetical protein